MIEFYFASGDEARNEAANCLKVGSVSARAAQAFMVGPCGFGFAPIALNKGM